MTMATILLATLMLLAQVPQDKTDKPAQDKKDPQGTYEPRSQPGAGQKFLARFAGDWTAHKTFFPQTGEGPVKAVGECKMRMIHDGRFLQAEFTFKNDGGQTTGTGLVGFDAASGKFTTTWVSSRMTQISLRQSQEPFSGEEIVLYSKPLNDDGKTPPRRSRAVSKLVENDQKIIHRHYAIQPDGTEKLMMEIVLTRKPAAAEAK
jgi:hypothetical protein